MLTTTEASAHLHIVETIDRSARFGLDWRYVHAATEPSLRAFEPRCQNCRHKLNVSPWVDGVRAYRCNWCSHSWREVPLWP